MSRNRPPRAAARTVRLLLLASLVMLGPLAATPSHAWTPPPAPLPIEPGDTDGMDDDDYDLSRPSSGANGAVSDAWPAPADEPAEVSSSGSRTDLLRVLLRRVFGIFCSGA